MSDYPDWFKRHRSIDFTLMLLSFIVAMSGVFVLNHWLIWLALGILLIVFISQTVRWRRLHSSVQTPKEAET